MRRILVAVMLAACGGAQTGTSSTQCPPGRTMLDGVCTSDAVVDYVSCVRAHGAKLGDERSKKLSAEAGYAGAHAAVASEAQKKLEKQYATSDANVLEVIRSCNAMRERQESACVAIGKIGMACGFDPDPGFVTSCERDAEYQRCAMAAGGDCNAFSSCGYEMAGRALCGGRGKPAGKATCEETSKCQASCAGDWPCICGCNEKLSPLLAHALAVPNQCVSMHCTGCAGAACNTCFQTHCSEKYQRACAGH